MKLPSGAACPLPCIFLAACLATAADATELRAALGIGSIFSYLLLPQPALNSQ